MDQVRDQPLAGTCAKGTLLGLTRTGCLIGCAALASLLLVELPIPLGGATEAPHYVPAGEAWIELEDDQRETPQAAVVSSTCRSGSQALSKPGTQQSAPCRVSSKPS